MLDIPVMKKQSSTKSKENEDVIKILACKIRVTCSMTDYELESVLACKKDKFIVRQVMSQKPDLSCKKENDLVA